MFGIDDFVFYGFKGVCRITAVCDSPFDRKDATKYYVLKPVGVLHASTYYAPVDNAAIPMRSVLTADQAQGLLRRAPQVGVAEGLSDKQRRDFCRTSLAECDPDAYLCVIKTLTLRRAALEKAGKQLSSKETELERMARFHIATELTVALGWKIEEAMRKLEESLCM